MDSKVLAPAVYFADQIRISQWAFWTEQHAQYIWFLPKTAARKETNVPIHIEKLTILKYTVVTTHLDYMEEEEAFLCLSFSKVFLEKRSDSLMDPKYPKL